MPHVDLASIMEAAVTEKLERLEAKRFGKTKKTRKSLEEADTSPGVRGISAPVRLSVWERDKGQCTFVSEDGRRCPAREGRSSTTTSPMVSAAIEAPRILGFAAPPTTVTWLSFTTAKKRWTATVVQPTAYVNRNRRFNSV